jgi:hypothetical protein
VLVVRYIGGDLYFRVEGDRPAPGKTWERATGDDLAVSGLPGHDPTAFAGSAAGLLHSRGPATTVSTRSDGAVTCRLAVPQRDLFTLPVGSRILRYVSAHPGAADHALRSTMPAQATLDRKGQLVGARFDLSLPLRALARLLGQPAHGVVEIYEVRYSATGSPVRIPRPDPRVVAPVSP